MMGGSSQPDRIGDPVCEWSGEGSKSTDPVYMYVESDWARTFYSLGHWFDDHPEAAFAMLSRRI